MAVSALAWLNGALFAAQLFVNGKLSRNIGPMSRKHETLITPAPYAFAIWGLIYTLLSLAVIIDCGCPFLSIYAATPHATLLRLAFALSCVMNIAWVALFSNGYINSATGVLVVLWLALLSLYMHILADRRERGFSYSRYIVGELPIIAYFAWTCAATLISVAVTCQDISHDFLSLPSYVALLSLLVVATLAAVLFEGEVAFGLVAIWALVAVYVKELHDLEPRVKRTSLSVRSCAGMSAAIIAACIVIALVLRVFNRYRSNNSEHNDLAVPFLNAKTGEKVDYGSNA